VKDEPPGSAGEKDGEKGQEEGGKGTDRRYAALHWNSLPSTCQLNYSNTQIVCQVDTHKNCVSTELQKHTEHTDCSEAEPAKIPPILEPAGDPEAACAAETPVTEGMSKEVEVENIALPLFLPHLHDEVEAEAEQAARDKQEEEREEAALAAAEEAAKKAEADAFSKLEAARQLSEKKAAELATKKSGDDAAGSEKEAEKKALSGKVRLNTQKTRDEEISHIRSSALK
jgi:hypothetical protein